MCPGWVWHRSHRGLAAGGVTRMGGNRASGFRRAAIFWPRDNTRRGRKRPRAAQKSTIALERQWRLSVATLRRLKGKQFRIAPRLELILIEDFDRYRHANFDDGM